jgi:hypothetical protein
MDPTETPSDKKKGRPKKTLVVEQVEKKQRGRKKKVIDENTEPLIIKKRGRKPVAKYYSATIKTNVPDISTIESFILKIEDDIIENNLEMDTLPEESILSEFIDSNNTIYKDTEHENIKDLYEKKLSSRKSQDLLLLNNCKNDQFNILENENEKPKSLEKDTNIVLYKYYENTEWIEDRDVCCFWCCNKFTTPALGLPIMFNIKINKFKVRGVFCSFPCMIAYNKDCKLHKESLIDFLYKYMCGSKLNNKGAPPRECLDMFGGKMDINEFRSIHELKTISILNYPMYPTRDYIEEINIDKVKADNTQVFNMKIKSEEKTKNSLDFLHFS